MIEQDPEENNIVNSGELGEGEENMFADYVPVTAEHNGQTVMLWWMNGQDERMVGGIFRICSKGTMCQRALGHNRYSEEKTPIPYGAICDSLNDYQFSHFCRDAVPEPDFKGQGLEMLVWEDSVRDQCLTIADILDLQPGQQIKVLHMDRNLGDSSCQNSTGNHLFRPSDFFRTSTAVYTHESGLKGTIKYSWQDGPDYRDDPECQNPRPFEFDLEYKRDSWYPLNNGCLPARDPQGFSDFNYNVPKPWQDFSATTRVGWRGPMLLWDKVDDQPDVYWYDSDDR